MSRPIHNGDVFRAIAHPARRKILDLLLAAGDQTATDIVQTLQLSNAAVSQHLRMLRDARLVAQRRTGRFRTYTLQKGKASEIAKWGRKFTK